jgi:hypothetical protein
MVTETQPIPNSIMGFDIRNRMPRPLLEYTQYSMFICPQCGKLEIFLKKPVQSLEDIAKALKVLKNKK